MIRFISFCIPDLFKHTFSNLFRRDETFDLIQQLAQEAIQRLLKSTASDQNPTSISLLVDSTESHLRIGSYDKSAIKKALDDQKKNTKYQLDFNLPGSEHLLDEMAVNFSVASSTSFFEGTAYLSTNCFAFISEVRHQCYLCFPYFLFKKVERIKTATTTLAITTSQDVRILFELLEDKDKVDHFCSILRDKLQAQVPLMKKYKKV